MYLRILKKDLKRKKSTNVILLIFITLASMFIASSVNNMSTIVHALDNYFEMAKVPDYWFGISSETDMERFEEFAYENDYAYSSIELLSIAADDVMLEERKLEYANNVSISQLGGINVFDKEGNEVTEINDGEVYVTAEVFFSKNNHFYEGAKLTIDCGGVYKEFTVKGYVRDALFGARMFGMTRLLVSENDYALFEEKNAGTIQSICVYTDDLEFDEKYTELDPNLIFNVDYSLCKMMYLVDMLIAAIILVVSICLILISMVILHFTISFTMTEEFREIGVMKAIGIPNFGIRGLYIAKYFAISIVGAIVGLILSVPFGRLLLDNISQNIIVYDTKNVLVNILCVVLTVVIVVLFCYFCTRKIKKFSPIDAIRNGETGERYSKKGIVHLSRWNGSPIVFMSLNDILSGLRKYLSMILIFTLGLLLVIIPLNTINTLQSDNLILWFSLSKSDHVIPQDMLFSANRNNEERICDNLDEIRNKLKENGIEAEVYQEIMFRMTIAHGDKKTSSIAFLGVGGVTTGQYSYLEGTPPESTKEVAVSYLVAEKLGVGIGDDVEINTGNEVKTYTVSAINQTMNNGGEGIRFYQEEKLDMSYAVGNLGIQIKYTDAPDGKTLQARKELLAKLFPDDKVYTAGEYVDDMIGNVAGMLNSVKQLILVVVLMVNMLVAVLMVKSFITKEKSEIAILKAIGFRNGSLVIWQTVRISLVLLISVIFGTLLSTPLSHLVIEPIFHMMGAYSIEFEVKAIEVYVIYPLIVLGVTSFAAMLSAQSLRKISAAEASNIE